MATPFVAFETPDVRTSTPETLATGLLIGAIAGSVVPALALGAELLAGTSVQSLAASPPPALLVAFFVPAVAGFVGAWVNGRVATYRQAWQSVSEKAGSLMDESWDLREQLDSQPVPDVEPLPEYRATRLQSDEDVLGPVVEVQLESDDEALVEAQTLLLHSVGSATRDTARRMQINLQGLELTPLTIVQERLVRALTGHLDGLWELADDVVQYAEEDPTTAPGARSGRARAAA